MDSSQNYQKSKNRVKLNNKQIHFLSHAYEKNPKPSFRERQSYAENLGIGADKVKNWFQNRRAKDRKDNSDGPCLEFHSISENRMLSYNLFPNCSDLFRRRRTN